MLIYLLHVLIIDEMHPLMFEAGDVLLILGIFIIARQTVFPMGLLSFKKSQTLLILTHEHFGFLFLLGSLEILFYRLYFILFEIVLLSGSVVVLPIGRYTKRIFLDDLLVYSLFVP